MNDKIKSVALTIYKEIHQVSDDSEVFMSGVIRALYVQHEMLVDSQLNQAEQLYNKRREDLKEAKSILNGQAP